MKQVISKLPIPLILCVTFALGLVAALAMRHSMTHSNPTGFRRVFNEDVIHHSREFNLGYNSYYIAGLDDENIYLGNNIATVAILKVNFNLKDTSHHIIRVAEVNGVLWEAVKANVRANNVFLFEGMRPSILYTNSVSRTAYELNIDSTFFSAAVPLSKSSMILKVFDLSKNQYVLIKKREGVAYETPTDGLLVKQVDGRFSVDGTLLYDPKSALLTYVYFYRNEFIMMDSNLNHLYTAHTIDTVRKAQIKVSELKAGDQTEYTMSTPPLLINKLAAMSKQWLLVNSARRADNEEKKIFESSAVIDIFQLENGDYVSSFHLENYKGNRLKSMAIQGDTLVAIFGPYLLTYRITIER